MGSLLKKLEYSIDAMMNKIKLIVTDKDKFDCNK